MVTLEETKQAVQNLLCRIEAQMAKKKRDALGDFAEDVGRLLGTTERKASEWLSQRSRRGQRSWLLSAIRRKRCSRS